MEKKELEKRLEKIEEELKKLDIIIDTLSDVQSKVE